MSLAQHVTQAEGFDYERLSCHDPIIRPANGREASAESVIEPAKWRRMSFAPVDFPYQRPRTAAYRVSTAKRCAQVATAVVACWLSAGIVFGFAALKPVLISEGVYGDLCDFKTISHSGNNDGSHLIPCDKQDLALNLFFIVASVTANVSSLLAGSILDTYGRRACWVVACMALALGSLLMAASFAIAKLNGYLVANVLLSVGGTFIFVPSFQLANAFPKHSGIIVAMVTGAFDASAAVFLIYRLVYDRTHGSFSLHTFFFSYAIVPTLIILAEFAYMPRHPYHTITELERKIDEAQDNNRDIHVSDQDVHDRRELARIQNARADRRRATLSQIENIAGDADQREERRRANAEQHTASGVWGVLHGLPARKQILTPWFMLILLLTTLQMLRMNYFIATIRAQYRYMLGSEDIAATLNHFFDIALPVGGVASTPVIGMLLNNLSVPTIFVCLTVLIGGVGVLNCIPHLWAGYVTVVVFVILRPLYYSAISDYATKVFGFGTFGRIYGTLVCVSGLINLAQTGLDSITHDVLQGNPIPVNAALAAAGALSGAVLTVFVTVRGREFVAGEQTKLDSSREYQRLLSDGQAGYGTDDRAVEFGEGGAES